MTGFDVERFSFLPDDLAVWGDKDPRHHNWPVVYVVSSGTKVYVGESNNVRKRISQHLKSTSKRGLRWVRVILDETFNKSACLDLESFLIRMFSGDGRLQVLNRNAGITDADYYARDTYYKTFDAVFERLRRQQLFDNSIPDIVNGDLYKLSPFKALNYDQAIVVESILDGFFVDIEANRLSTVVIQGGPGTGKTVLAIFLLKLIEDIKRHDPEERLDSDSAFNDYFVPGHAELLAPLKIGIVVPQQSLRESISRVFTLTPGLHKDLVLTPFTVGESDERFDLLIVDEAHRLNQRANQASGVLNKKFADINRKLFGEDDPALTQLDWIQKQSDHVILMLDPGQSVRPADLPSNITNALVAGATKNDNFYQLRSQMRIKAEQDYVRYVRDVFSDNPPAERQHFEGYDLRTFTDLSEMRTEILRREQEYGLSRIVAGYAWPWRSRYNPDDFDIEIDGEHLRWNTKQRDWINSASSVDEVGSIHTVQGYDLNFAGVIIGNDLRFDPASGRTFFDRSNYHDTKGRENNPRLGITYSDVDILQYIRNIYTVLLTRGMRGTYIYVCDPELRRHLRRYF